MPIKNGAAVRQIMPKPIEGVVIDRKFNDSEDQMEYHIESPDADGDGAKDRRWFLESKIETVEPTGDAA